MDHHLLRVDRISPNVRYVQIAAAERTKDAQLSEATRRKLQKRAQAKNIVASVAQRDYLYAT
jgi:hypothetical protein